MLYDPPQLDIFQEPTTYLDAYRRHRHCPRADYHPWLRRQPPESESQNTAASEALLGRLRQIDHETLHPRHPNQNVPFSLLHHPKPITQTNPAEKFDLRVQYVDPDKEDVRKTRPRVVMTPGISLDDVEDEDLRKFIISQVYATEWGLAAERAAPPMVKKEVPNCVAETSDNLKYQPDLYPPLPEGWREKGKVWDKAQPRMTVDPTRSFWVAHLPDRPCPDLCTPCEPRPMRVPPSVSQKLRALIEEDLLRLPHDKAIPGYAGYTPFSAKGVPLEKADLPVYHPLLSTNQALQRRFIEDKLKKGPMTAIQEKSKKQDQQQEDCPDYDKLIKIKCCTCCRRKNIL